MTNPPFRLLSRFYSLVLVHIFLKIKFKKENRLNSILL
ncbi:hypothetical protein [Enterocloster phage PMBT24]|uniref:Uncharacterized protein n=1 Tax=Enterocloster phage PMBT24 TaxID=3025413 RepID=A0AAT9TW02_9CAUD|nr:hypothetical protein [Enterocloster phage PMBT24]